MNNLASLIVGSVLVVGDAVNVLLKVRGRVLRHSGRIACPGGGRRVADRPGGVAGRRVAVGSVPLGAVGDLTGGSHGFNYRPSAMSFRICSNCACSGWGGVSFIALAVIGTPASSKACWVASIMLRLPSPDYVSAENAVVGTLRPLRADRPVYGNLAQDAVLSESASDRSRYAPLRGRVQDRRNRLSHLYFHYGSRAAGPSGTKAEALATRNYLNTRPKIVSTCFRWRSTENVSASFSLLTSSVISGSASTAARKSPSVSHASIA